MECLTEGFIELNEHNVHGVTRSLGRCSLFHCQQHIGGILILNEMHLAQSILAGSSTAQLPPVP